jgi:AcrR family transcriptional regulator
MYLRVKRASCDDSGAMPIERLTPERRREMTRTALIEAAAEVFTRRGFHAASLEEIAEVAGFTRGAIYSNFGGKEEIFIALLDHLTEQQLTAFGHAMDSSTGSVQERSQAASAIWGHTQREQRLPMLSLEMRLYAMRNPDFRRRLALAERRQQEQIATFIERIATQENRALTYDARDLAEILRAFSDGLSQLAAVDEERATYYESLAARFFNLIDEVIPEKASPTPTKGSQAARRAKSGGG